LYDYTLTGVQEGDEVEVDILSITAGWEARVVSLPQGDKPGWIGVKNLDNSDGKVFIYASNGKGKTDIKSLVFEGGVFEAEMDVQTIPAEGGEAVLTVVTNIDYELWKDPTAKWLTIADTKAVHTDVITLVAEPNTTGAYRSAEVDVLLQNTEEAYMVLQYPSQEEVTSISSLANVDNYVSVTLYNEPVVAASQYSVVVSDGTANLYVPYDHFDIGTILNITGFNSPDGFTVTNVEVVGEGGEVVETAFNYYGYGQIYSNIFTAYNGTLVVEEGVYMLQNDYGEDGIVSVIIEAPEESLGFAEMTPGNLVAAKGYIVGYMDGENEGDQLYMMVASAANEAVLAETGSIAYSNEGGDSFLWDYDKPYIQYAIYNSKIWDSFETKEEIVLYTAKTEADDYQYDFLDSYSFLFSPAELAPLVLYSVGEPVQMSSELPYGEYVVVAVSMDEYGRLQGPYGYLEMEKVEPETPKNAYEDFLGKWVVGNGTMSIDQDVAGESYKINGLFSMSATYGSSELSAQFVDGKLVIMEQLLGKWENTNYGMCSTYFTGLFKSGSSVYPHYTGADGNAKAPAQAVIAYVEDGKLNFIGGASEYSSNMIGYAVRWIIDEGANAGAGNWIYNGTKSANLPQAFDKAKEASEGYKKWLGSYTASPMDLGDDKGISMPITLSEGVADETIFINGLGIDGVPAKYVASTGNLQLIYNTPISASGTYEFVVAGTTNDGYVATGDENGVVAEFTMDADGKITAVSNPWYISDERPEVFASAFGVRGKKIADGGWVHFSDVADFVNPATLVKASTKSTSHNSVDALKLDNKLVNFESVKVAKKTSKVEKTPAQVKSVNFAKRTLSK
ncbi:MAG: BACON domain-containing protein, partial [Bacteroidales bacterium]|nr:BACON domain-containing protein [Candidatus Cryptobacteroides caccocaballi]